MAPDNSYLRATWPRIRKSVEYLIQLDGDENGLLEVEQYSTLDAAWESLVQDISAPLFNRAADGLYTPGSALGPFMYAAAAQQSQLPSLPAAFTYSLDGSRLDCASQPAEVSWGAAIANGCPGSTALLAETLGRAAFLEALDGLGLFTVPLIRLPAQSGLPPEAGFDIVHLLFSQEDAASGASLMVSPLEMALAAKKEINASVSAAMDRFKKQIKGSHEYLKAAKGVLVIPNVTKILGPLVDYSMIPAEKLERAKAEGRYVHKMIELDCAGDLDESALEEWAKPALKAWREFREISGFEPILSEWKGYHPALDVAGTLDLLCELPKLKGWKGSALVDGKRSLYGGPVIGLQLAAYKSIVEADKTMPRITRRGALRIGNDGKLRLEPYDDPLAV